jgi:lysophospholipase
MLAKLLRLALQGTVVAVLASSARALPEAELAASYDALIRPLVDGGEAGHFSGVDAVRVHYRIHAVDSPVGAVVLLPDYLESSLEYAETIHDLNAAGYSVYALDHRGTGRSERLTAKPRVAHVERFGDYVDDAETFVRDIVVPHASAPVHMLAHSTGALIGAMLLARAPEPFVSAAFTSPYFEMPSDACPEWVTYMAVSLNDARGAAKDYAPGHGDWSPSLSTFDANRMTRSETRWGIQLGQWQDHPDAAMGGPSNRLLRETMLASWARDEHARGIGGLPILLLQAEQDFYVGARGQERFCQAAASCRLVRVPGTRHELLMERDPARNLVLAEILALFAAAGAP